MIETFFSSIDWELFALIATPGISFLAFLVYGAALFTSIRQNHITTSASLIHYYEEEVRDLIDSGNQISFTDSTGNAELNAFNFPHHFTSALVFLVSDIFYQKDMEEGNFNAVIKFEDLKTKSYGSSLTFLNEFFGSMSDINQHLRYIGYLVEQVESSELTLSHKKIIRWKIRKKLAMPFLICYYQVKYSPDFPKELPVSALMDWDSKENLVLMDIKETEFFKTIQSIDKKLTS